MYFLPDKSSISKAYTGGKVELLTKNTYRSKLKNDKNNTMIYSIW